MINKLYKAIPIIVTLIITGCASAPPYDYSALKEEAPRSILVIPPLNNSVEVSASYSYLSTISEPLAEKGYYVFPVSLIDSFLKENGLPTPVEMNSIPLDKIKQHIGADAVLYVTVEDWGQKYVLLSSYTITKGSIKLVSTNTGNTLWHAPFEAQVSSDSGGNGLVGALVSAVVNQIAGSINDRTPGVARLANNRAIFSKKRGLLVGPYAPQPGVKQ